MKLGTQTASLTNHLMSRAVIGEPEVFVGMGATILHWTDRSPATITGIFKNGQSTIIEVTDDDYTRVDNNGLSECQEYIYTTNSDNPSRFFRKNRKTGYWEAVYKNAETGRWNASGGASLRIGHREKYHDFSF